jgi:integrase/recombinase XerD
MTLQEAISTFLLHCRYGKNLSPKTLAAYSIDLRQFKDHLARAGEVPAVTAIDKTVLRGFIQSLFKGNAETTVKRKVATLKALFNFLEREDAIATNPFRKMDIRIRETRRLPRAVALPDLKRLFLHLYGLKQRVQDQDSHAYRVLVRDIAVLEVLFATGARVSEACHLRSEDVDLSEGSEGSVRLLGKGGRERIIQLCDPETLEALRSHRRLWSEGKSDGYFFRNRLGGRLSDQSVRVMLRKYAVEAGLALHLTPHMLRHSVATLLLEEDVDIRYIQHLLGHTSIATTQIYTAVQASKQRDILSARHPRRKIRLQS